MNWPAVQSRYDGGTLGWTTTQRGSSPTAISAILLLTSFPFLFLTWMIETLFTSRLTTTTRVSSEVSAMLVERVGAASAGAAIRSGKNNCCRYQQPGRGIRAKLSGETSGFVNFS